MPRLLAATRSPCAVLPLPSEIPGRPRTAIPCPQKEGSMTFPPTITAQLIQIQAKLRERTICSPQPTHHVDNPVWYADSLLGRPMMPKKP